MPSVELYCDGHDTWVKINGMEYGLSVSARLNRGLPPVPDYYRTNHPRPLVLGAKRPLTPVESTAFSLCDY